MIFPKEKVSIRLHLRFVQPASCGQKFIIIWEKSRSFHITQNIHLAVFYPKAHISREEVRWHSMDMDKALAIY